MRKIIALVSLVLILAAVNWSIYHKEKQLAEGRIVYLELAPVDPRSLMQGDYMALRFQLADNVYGALPKNEEAGRWRNDVTASDGSVVVRLDARHIGSFKSLYTGQPLSEGEVILRYRVRNGAVKFATNAFFFQEGQGEYYQPAKYGQFRVDGKGELLLSAMYDANLKKLGPDGKD